MFVLPIVGTIPIDARRFLSVTRKGVHPRLDGLAPAGSVTFNAFGRLYSSNDLDPLGLAGAVGLRRGGAGDTGGRAKRCAAGVSGIKPVANGVRDCGTLVLLGTA